jgi:aspartokinase/homoserine dehydrogenase 1
MNLSLLAHPLHPPAPAQAATLDLVLIGTGTVGGQLLDLLARRGPEARPRIRLAAVANSRRQIADPSGLDPDSSKSALQDGDPLDPAKLRALGAVLHNPVLVDCTSAESVVDAYASFAEHGFSIATPNKKLASGPLPRLRKVQAALTRRGRAFRNETNVGAGLPVLSTLRDLAAGGDEIARVEGILSGSLSFLCGRLEDGVPFSEALLEAKRLGFTEPDPRDDLSGLDMARKALILHRELGGHGELDGVAVESLLPETFDASGRVDAFLARCRELDAPLRARVASLEARGEALRVVAEADAHGARVRVRALEAGHPLRALRDGENALAFHSAAYRDRPLVVRGYGAGAAVTAIGLLADLLKIEARP